MSPRLAGEVLIRAPVNPSPRRSRTPRSRTTTGLFAVSRSRLPASDDDGPLLIRSPRAFDGRSAATDVKSILLRPAGHS